MSSRMYYESSDRLPKKPNRNADGDIHELKQQNAKTKLAMQEMSVQNTKLRNRLHEAESVINRQGIELRQLKGELDKLKSMVNQMKGDPYANGQNY